jgi:hypothetical protein
MSAAPTLAPDAAMALGIASTAMPFARTPEDEVERWLRVLLLHGRVGTALRALGVSEVPRDGGEGSAGTHPPGSGEPRDPVALVTEHALRIAGKRHAQALATTDVLLAVIHVYGENFDRVLRAHGAECEELLEFLGVEDSAIGD